MSDLLDFDNKLLSYFGATSGAGSIVTAPDEAKKRQITATQNAERPIIESIYKEIPIGKKEDLGEKCMFQFRLYPTGQMISLPMLFRPPDIDGKKRNELRIYMHSGIFSPTVGLYWFVFVKSGELWIGALSSTEISAAKAGIVIDKFEGFQSFSEDFYQEIVNSPAPPKAPPPLIATTSTGFQRDPIVARDAILGSSFECELLPKAEIFVSRKTGKPYLEAHHLVPMFWQRHIQSQSIDIAENICVLNPFAHKMIHHGRFDDIKGHITVLAEKRSGFLKAIEMDIGQVLEIYKSLSS